MALTRSGSGYQLRHKLVKRPGWLNQQVRLSGRVRAVIVGPRRQQSQVVRTVLLVDVLDMGSAAVVLAGYLARSQRPPTVGNCVDVSGKWIWNAQYGTMQVSTVGLAATLSWQVLPAQLAAWTGLHQALCVVGDDHAQRRRMRDVRFYLDGMADGGGAQPFRVTAWEPAAGQRLLSRSRAASSSVSPSRRSVKRLRAVLDTSQRSPALTSPLRSGLSSPAVAASARAAALTRARRAPRSAPRHVPLQQAVAAVVMPSEQHDSDTLLRDKRRRSPVDVAAAPAARADRSKRLRRVTPPLQRVRRERRGSAASASNQLVAAMQGRRKSFRTKQVQRKSTRQLVLPRPDGVLAAEVRAESPVAVNAALAEPVVGAEVVTGVVALGAQSAGAGPQVPAEEQHAGEDEVTDAAAQPLQHN